jgi:hypothetical protein
MAVDETVSTFDRIEAVLRNPAVYELAKLVPERQPGDAGRPSDFPSYMLFVFDALISVYGSARKVDAELADRNVWHFMRRIVKKVHKGDDSMRLPPYRYRRHHYMYGRTRYLTDPRSWRPYRSSTVCSLPNKHANLGCLTRKVRDRSRDRRSTGLCTRTARLLRRCTKAVSSCQPEPFSR